MQESARCFHNLEWPALGARLAGPVVWLRGWVVGKPGHAFTDVRVRHAGVTHLGVLGLPRFDLAAHFHAKRPWLPAEYILGVPVTQGPVTLTVEVMDLAGSWQELHQVTLTIAPDGSPAPQVEGRLETSPDGTWTVRDAHHPFHGHLDDPGPSPVIRHGRVPVFGWLLDETQPLAAVLTTTDTLVFNHLAHSLTDEALAARVPQHAAARHARLRGQIDYSATLTEPACLRVYAVSPNGKVTLCFAQRLHPVTASPAPAPPPRSYPLISPRALPVLPSGRPRRLLVVLRTLWPHDATLRALDATRHLTGAHRWAARVVSTEDGPLRHDFERANVESLIVNPEPLFSARDERAMQAALTQLERQIGWRHLDAVAVFDPVCGWAIALAKQQGIPTLFDCGADEQMEPDPTAIPAVRSLLRAGWQEATGICFATAAAARAQQLSLSHCPAAIIPQWHSPILPAPAATNTPRVVFAPLRTTDWLVRQHPELAARWSFRQGPAPLNSAEQLAQHDDQFNLPSLLHSADWSLDGAALWLGPLFGRGPLRPVLDAAAAGLPLMAPRTPTTAEWFTDLRLPLAAEDNPLAFAHMLLAWEALPASFQRESALVAPIIRERHDPSRLLPQWENLLASTTATRG